MSKKFILLALAAILPFSGCKKAADYYHQFRAKKHAQTVAKAAPRRRPRPAATPAPAATSDDGGAAGHAAINKSAGVDRAALSPV